MSTSVSATGDISAVTEHGAQNVSELCKFPDGAYTALATPFCDDGSVDYPSLRRLLDTQYDSKIVGLVLLGSTAEAPTMSEEDKLGILKFVKEYDDQMLESDTPKHKMLIAGVGGSWTEQVVSFAKKAVEFCDALMVTVPAYNKPPQPGIMEHFCTIAQAFPKTPIMMYNIPSRTGTDMLPETICGILQKCDNVTALKEASGNMENVGTLIRNVEKVGRDLKSTFKIFSGDDGNAINLCENFCGRGVVSVASNVIPRKIANLMVLALLGKYTVAKEAVKRAYVDEFIESLFITSNPIPVKFLLNKLQIFSTDKMRRPLIEITDKPMKKELLATCEKVFGLEKILLKQ